MLMKDSKKEEKDKVLELFKTSGIALVLLTVIGVLWTGVLW